MELIDRASHIAQGPWSTHIMSMREETTLALDACEWDYGSYSFEGKPHFALYNAFVEPWLHLAVKV